MQGRFQIRLTVRASQNILDICSFIERDSPQNAASIARELLDAVDSLALLPKRYKIHEHRKDPAKTVHSMPVPPYIVYYRVLTPQEVVEVIAVRHGRQRQPRRIR